MAVSADLVLSTTLRALEAANAIFSRIVACYEPCSLAGSAEPGRDNGFDSAARLAWDPASTLETLVALIRSLVSTVVPALLAQREAATKRMSKTSISLKHARSARINACAAATAIDDIIGGLYALLLAPAVRAFTLLSEGYLFACFADGAASQGETTASADAPISVPDLRPDVFALLEGLLAILDAVLPANEPTTFTQASPPAGTAAAPAGPAAIPGSDQLRTLLALECVRALDTLYGPHGHGQQHAPGPPPDSPAQAYPHSPAPNLPSSAPARTSAASSGPLAARQGTAPAGFPLAGRAPPRAARNLGETALGAEPSGPQRGPVHDSVRAGAAASGSDGKAKEGGREGADADAGGRVRGARARIAGLARKDAVWWLCAVLGRLLPALSPPSAGAAGEGDQGADGGSTPPSVACADVAHEAVYAALADLLRRTRPCPRSGPRSGSGPARIAARRGCSSPIPRPASSPSPSPRGLSSCASNHEGGAAPEPPAASDDPVDAGTGLGLGAGRKSKRGLEKTNAGTHADGPGEEDRRAGWAGAGAGMGMGEVERGMLLAVLERAWLGF